MRRGTGHRPGAEPGKPLASVRAILHDQARGHGHGPIYLPLDHRSPRRTAWGDPVRTAGCSLSVYDPCHLGGRIVIVSMSLLGQKRKSAGPVARSALPAGTEVVSRAHQVRKVPNPDSCTATKRGIYSITYRRTRARAHSGNPAFRRPSINSFKCDCLRRPILADIVKAGSVSSRRAAASRASPSRPR